MKSIFYLLGSIVLSLFILITGKFVFAPLFLAVFMAILISPSVNFIEKRKVHSTLATLLSVLAIFFAIGTLFVVISLQYNTMIEEMPSFTDKLSTYSENIKGFITTQFGVSEGFVNRTAEQIKTQGKSQAGEVFGMLFLSLSSFASFTILLPVFTFLILIYRHTLIDFIRNVSKNYPDKTLKRWISTVSQIKDVVRNYLIGLLFVTLILATLNTIGLFVLGVPYPLVLGVSAAVLSIIPYIGNMIGGGLAALIALATGDVWSAVGVITLFGIIQALEGNLITPKVMADKVGVNPLVVIISLLIGGYVWGIVGMIVSVPLVAIMRVLFDNKEELQPFATLIEGNQ